MNIQEMKEKKKEKGYTNEQIAELSGVPLGTRAEDFWRCDNFTSL